MKCAIVIGTFLGVAIAHDRRGTAWNEYLFSKVTLKDCDEESDSCKLAKLYENSAAYEPAQFEKMLRMAFDQCVADSGFFCTIDVEVDAKIRFHRHCTTEEGISLYIPELRGWTMDQEIITDGFDVEGDDCETAVGIHTSLEEGEAGPTCNMRNPMNNTGNLAWGRWSPWKKEFDLTFVQPVYLDTFQLMPNGASESLCKYRSTNETNYSIKFFKQMMSDKKAD